MSDDHARKRRRLEPHADAQRNAAENQARGCPLDPGALEDVLDDITAEDATDAALCSDTMAALLFLRNQFPASAKTLALVLRSQVYTVLKDRTVVDRELEKHREEGSIRVIKLPSSVDDYGYILQEDYAASVRAARDSIKEAKATAAGIEVFDHFLERVLPRCKEASIAHLRLLTLLVNSSEGSGSDTTSQSEPQISLLLNSGLLTRQVGSQGGYLFAVAGGGRLVTSITRGRKEILGLLGRKRYKEAFVKDMQQWKLKSSCLDMQWHLRDLLGRGSVVEVQSPSGPLIRLARRDR